MHTKAWMLSSTAVSQILFLLALSPTACAQEWRFYGGDPGGTRSSSPKQINRQNVGSLKRAWTYHMGEVDRGGNETDRHHVAPFESTPIVIDGVLYFSTPSNRVIALDAESGQEIWQFDPQAGRAGPRQFFQHRGVAYWQSKAGDDRRILYGTFDGHLIALDAKTGKPCREFGKDGTVDLRVGVADAYPGAEYSVTSPPAIYQDLVIYERRRRARFDFSSYWLGLIRFLRRRPQGPGSVQQLPGGARRRNRQTRLVLPDGAPRYLGLRYARTTRADHVAARWRGYSCDCAGHKDGICVYPRPAYRKTAIPGRGTLRSQK